MRVDQALAQFVDCGDGRYYHAAHGFVSRSARDTLVEAMVTAFDPRTSPGHTDLMVSPESIDEMLDAVEEAKLDRKLVQAEAERLGLNARDVNRAVEGATQQAMQEWPFSTERSARSFIESSLKRSLGVSSARLLAALGDYVFERVRDARQHAAVGEAQVDEIALPSKLLPLRGELSRAIQGRREMSVDQAREYVRTDPYVRFEPTDKEIELAFKALGGRKTGRTYVFESLDEAKYSLNVAKVPLEQARAYAEAAFVKVGKDLDKEIPDFDLNYRALQDRTKTALNVPRVQMPVIEPEDMDQFEKRLKAGSVDIFKPWARGKLYTPTSFSRKVEGDEWVKLGFQDDNPGDDQLRAARGTRAANTLYPTQSQIWLEKLVDNLVRFGVPGAGSPVTKATIIVSREGYILDGHHRFGQAMLANPTLKLRTLFVPLGIKLLLKVGRSYGEAIGNKVKESTVDEGAAPKDFDALLTGLGFTLRETNKTEDGPIYVYSAPTGFSVRVSPTAKGLVHWNATGKGARVGIGIDELRKYVRRTNVRRRYQGKGEGAMYEATLDGIAEADDAETARFHKQLLSARSSPAKRKKLGFSVEEIDYLTAVISSGAMKADALYSLKKYGPGRKYEATLDEVDPITAIGMLGAIGAGAGIGMGVVKAVRNIQKLLRTGRKSAAEKAWDKIDPKDRAKLERLLHIETVYLKRESVDDAPKDTVSLGEGVPQELLRCDEFLIDEDGTPRVFRDRAWLVRNWPLVQGFVVETNEDDDTVFYATLANGAESLRFDESEEFTRGFIGQPVFRGLPVDWFGERQIVEGDEWAPNVGYVDETTIAKYEVQQKRKDTPVEAHMQTPNLADAKAKALALSKTDITGIAYVKDGTKVVAAYYKGKPYAPKKSTTFGALSIGDRWGRPGDTAVLQKVSATAAQLVRLTTGQPEGRRHRVSSTTEVVLLPQDATVNDESVVEDELDEGKLNLPSGYTALRMNVSHRTRAKVMDAVGDDGVPVRMWGGKVGILDAYEGLIVKSKRVPELRKEFGKTLSTPRGADEFGAWMGPDTTKHYAWLRKHGILPPPTNEDLGEGRELRPMVPATVQAGPNEFVVSMREGQSLASRRFYWTGSRWSSARVDAETYASRKEASAALRAAKKAIHPSNIPKDEAEPDDDAQAPTVPKSPIPDGYAFVSAVIVDGQKVVILREKGKGMEGGYALLIGGQIRADKLASHGAALKKAKEIVECYDDDLVEWDTDPDVDLGLDEADAQRAYDAELARYRKAFAKFDEVRTKYRARKIGDDEFLAARKAFDRASAALDKAEQALLDANESLDEVSPPGWKGSVEAMKRKHPEIDNPWALAWSMKNKGFKSHYKKDGTKKDEDVLPRMYVYECAACHESMSWRAFPPIDTAELVLCCESCGAETAWDDAQVEESADPLDRFNDLRKQGFMRGSKSRVSKPKNYAQVLDAVKKATLGKPGVVDVESLSKRLRLPPDQVARAIADIYFNESIDESSVASTILDQLGGNRFRVMTGAKDFVATNSGRGGVRFRIGRNAKGVNVVSIMLTGADTYDVEYLSVRGAKVTVKAKEEDIYADQLRDSFERNTGMRTSLGTMGESAVDLSIVTGAGMLEGEAQAERGDTVRWDDLRLELLGADEDVTADDVEECIELIEAGVTGWRTTTSGHRIYLENGKVTKGNPHLVKAVGAKSKKAPHSKITGASLLGVESEEDYDGNGLDEMEEIDEAATIDTLRKLLVQNPDQAFSVKQLAMAASTSEMDARKAVNQLVIQGTAQFKRGEGYSLASGGGLRLTAQDKAASRMRQYGHRTHGMREDEDELHEAKRAREGHGETRGRYTFEGGDKRMCTCGHPLGIHSAERVTDRGRKLQPCFVSDVGGECDCQCFTPARKRKRKSDESTRSSAVGGFRKGYLGAPDNMGQEGGIRDDNPRRRKRKKSVWAGPGPVEDADSEDYLDEDADDSRASIQMNMEWDGEFKRYNVQLPGLNGPPGSYPQDEWHFDTYDKAMEFAREQWKRDNFFLVVWNLSPEDQERFSTPQPKGVGETRVSADDQTVEVAWYPGRGKYVVHDELYNETEYETVEQAVGAATAMAANGNYLMVVQTIKPGDKLPKYELPAYESDLSEGMELFVPGDVLVLGQGKSRRYLVVALDRWDGVYAAALSGTEKGSQIAGTKHGDHGTRWIKVGDVADAEFTGKMAGKLRRNAQGMIQRAHSGQPSPDYWKAGLSMSKLPPLGESEEQPDEVTFQFNETELEQFVSAGQSVGVDSSTSVSYEKGVFEVVLPSGTAERMKELMTT